MRATVLLAILLLGAGAPCAQEVVVDDDAAHAVRLPTAATRIVSLAPHLTELLYAAGAGSKIVGAVAHSDYPAAARLIVDVGAYDHPNVERIVRLQPDLIVAWESGTPPVVIETLRRFHLPVFISQPRLLDDIPRSIERLGVLAGAQESSATAAARFRRRLSALRAAYAGRSKITAFYQVWNQPLMSVGGRHLISDVLRLCGADNILKDATALALTVNLEAIIAADPQIIIASGMAEERPEWLDDWRQWPRLSAVRNANLYFVPPDLIQRHTPRILEGAELLCRQVEEARSKRDQG